MRKTTLLIILIILINSISVCADYSLLQNAVIAAPGSSQSDWSAIALSVSGNDFDKDAYLTGLKNYVQQKYLTKGKLSANKATEWHRIAIAVNLLGCDATNFCGINLLNDGVYYRGNLGSQGLNGYIWALIAISSGNYIQPADALNTKESIISTILSSQNSDGSFSLSGNEPDCDITAMAVYALSFYKNNSDVSVAIDNALNYLSSVQNPDGTFSDGDVPNAESTAQVIIALASTQRDPYCDLHFPNLYNALKSFETLGGFCHIQGGEADIIATYQAYCAIAAAERKVDIYSNYQSNEITAEPTTEAETKLVSQSLNNPTPKETEETMPTEAATAPTEIETVTVLEIETQASYDLTAKISLIDNNHINLFLIIIPFVFIAICVIIIVKIRHKRFFVILFAIILSLSLLLLANGKSVENFYRSTVPEGDLHVTISIDCSSILSNYSSLDESLKRSGYVPENGIILPQTEVYITQGSSVLDILKLAAKENKIQLEYTQSPNDSYVEGINHIYEFSCGELSGWMYKVNGVFASKGCNSYIAEDGDVIEWIYTCDLGKDVREDF